MYDPFVTNTEDDGDGVVFPFAVELAIIAVPYPVAKTIPPCCVAEVLELPVAVLFSKVQLKISTVFNFSEDPPVAATAAPRGAELFMKVAPLTNKV
jgi:hypothetical protein